MLIAFCLPPTGTRMFPPSSGLTFSCWFLVSKFGVVHNSHPVRFLTVVRHMARTEQEFVCFSISFSPQDNSLVISTEEVEFQPLGEAFLNQAAVLCPVIIWIFFINKFYLFINTSNINDAFCLFGFLLNSFCICYSWSYFSFKFAVGIENYLVVCDI